MRLFRSTPLVLGLLVIACERGAVPDGQDSVVLPGGDTALSVEPVADGTAGAPRAGATVMVHMGAAEQGFIVAGARSAGVVTLVTRGGQLQRATVAPSGADACSPATVSAEDGAPLLPWSVALGGQGVTPVTVDSLGSLSRADSMALGRAVTRLASQLPGDSVGRFEGRAFNLETLWSMQPEGLPRTVVATLRRQIDQEASPLEERTFVVAEQSVTTGEWTVAYWERSQGLGESVEAREFLAAVVQAGRAAMLVSRDYGDGVALSMLQRRGTEWVLAWTSARRRC
jgi:hypothetical protein